MRHSHAAILARQHAPKARRAYTLVEILVVIAVVLLLITMSVPLFNIILGNRSTEAARNQVSAMLAIARTEAMARQEPRGLAIFDDPATGRTRLAIVVPEPAPSQPHNIDLSPSHDPALLQPGVGARVLLNDGTFPAPNRLGDTAKVWVGAIWFDGRGVVHSRPFTVQGNSDLGRLVGTAYVSQISHHGLVLYDREAYGTESKNLTDATAANTYLREKGLWLIVGRYSGTLIQGE
mgnify:CR=1 FL=1